MNIVRVKAPSRFALALTLRKPPNVQFRYVLASVSAQTRALSLERRMLPGAARGSGFESAPGECHELPRSWAAFFIRADTARRSCCWRTAAFISPVSWDDSRATTSLPLRRGWKTSPNLAVSRCGRTLRILRSIPSPNDSRQASGGCLRRSRFLEDLRGFQSSGRHPRAPPLQTHATVALLEVLTFLKTYFRVLDSR
jgi:hypothetical protein